jgi:hypothetical protein
MPFSPITPPVLPEEYTTPTGSPLKPSSPPKLIRRPTLYDLSSDCDLLSQNSPLTPIEEKKQLWEDSDDEISCKLAGIYGIETKRTKTIETSDEDRVDYCHLCQRPLNPIFTSDTCAECIQYKRDKKSCENIIWDEVDITKNDDSTYYLLERLLRIKWHEKAILGLYQ